MLSFQTHAVYRDLKGDSGFEGFRGSQEKGLRDSGVKSEAVVKFRFKFQALAVCAALMTFAATGWGQILGLDGGFQSWAELWRNSGGESVSVKDERSCG